MIVCISGASGLIGTALTSELRHRGATVRCLVRGTPNGEDEFEWLPSEDRLDQRAIEGVDAVVHLAGESIAGLYWSTSKKQRILESRVRSTHLLATALANAKQKPKVFLSASAVGYYGSRDAEEVNETSTSGDNFLAEVCRQWEAAAAPARAAGIRVVHPRTGIVLTKKGGALKQMLLPFRLGLGGRLGSGAQYVSWITLDDEVA
ncbi:MAG: TIGR01777 family oxidoreductase, partial [Bdellovibrionales bacterium]|nr:TIGR01777 family oxidoreductase [Bdellovibrionales bacterium]